MVTTIEAHEHPLGKIFDDDYQFQIPLYQRPYSWTSEHAGELLGDVLSFAVKPGELHELDPYFLGSLVLTKETTSPVSLVVDGQQRLTTLTLLFSVLQTFVGDDYRGGVRKRLQQAGDPTMGLAPSPRLRLREQDAEFAERYILAEGDPLSRLRDLDPGQLSEAQRKLRSNALLFGEKLAELDQSVVERLVAYLSQMTYLVVVATPDFDSAYRIFSVLNERGLDLSHSDVFKAEVIGRIPEADRAEYTKRWEGEEEDLEREDFADLFGHIRMIKAKTKQRETILKEFRIAVLDQYTTDGRAFVDDVLVPYSDAFEVIRDATYHASHMAGDVNRLLRWLNELDNADWVPVAMEYLRRHEAQPAFMVEFLTDLDRLAASLFIRRIDLTRRIERYGQVLKAIEAEDDLSAEDSALQLTPDERKQTMARLDEDVYLVTRIRKYVLLRLDETFSDTTAIYDYPLITVEHVLPQNPPSDSHWVDAFSEDERGRWTHRLANLVLLSQRRNTQASNRPFQEKKETYFQTKDGSSPFVITSQVLATPEWTPLVLEGRQSMVLERLRSLWRL